jgi:hypothetical protein
VTGGKAPYTVDAIGQASPFAEVKADDREAGKLTAKVKEAATVGEYTLQVRSADDLVKQFKLKVEAK